jgi:dienelactone hydrolase
MKKRIHPAIVALLAILGLIVLMAGIFTVWARNSYKADDTALLAMAGTAEAKATDTRAYVFFDPIPPAGAEATGKTGLIFYPGGKVMPEAYAPLLLQIAASGHPVVLCRMPLNLAVFKIGAAADVFAMRSDTRWAIGGHSLGGSMAASYAYKHPDAVAGLVLLGSYPAGSNSFAESSLAVLSVFGSKDMGIDKIRQFKSLLPASATYAELEGGNHAQFGNYGFQSGDGTATMPRLEQQNLALKAIVKFLDGLDAR